MFGVLDGHGAENGALVAKVASDAIQEHLAANFGRLRSTSQSEVELVFTTAFERAHDAARKAVLAVDPAYTLGAGTVPVDDWEDEDGVTYTDAVDGGTTATVIALVDGAKLLHAQVGDSSALLGGTMRDADADAEGEISFEELMEEHSATNVAKTAPHTHRQCTFFSGCMRRARFSLTVARAMCAAGGGI